MKKFSRYVLSLPRFSKRIIVILTDSCLCLVCSWLAFSLVIEEFNFFENAVLYSSFLSIIISLPIFWLFGLYFTVFRYFGLSIIYTLLASIFLYGFLYFLVIAFFPVQGIPRSIGVLHPMLLFFSIISTRLLVKYILTGDFNFNSSSNKQNILIYGAGSSGRQLVLALENSPEFNVIGFLDDDHHLHRQSILGKTVYAPSNLQNLVQDKNIRFAFLALPRINRSKRNLIIENLNQNKLVVKTLPSISEIVDGRISISDIKDLNIDDLLSRDEVKPDLNLLNKNINSKTVLVTGAGGSIGSELCRQIVRLKPNKLILLELNEFALYKTYEQLSTLNTYLKIVPLLVNTQDQKKLEIIFETFKVDTVYHAAAYKHVTLVEENICEGVKNNVFSTLAVAQASVITNVSNLVLISSDKAVRSTNIMGASKRLSELCLQGIYNYTKDIGTHFSIVRFGNVLESSGSVIPKFRKQIREGGPITLTHPDITRYFMTITEAAQLVIQAGAMGKKSEVFVLDMGKSVRIKDLIYKMVSLSGLTVKDSKNPNGDIEVKITGLKQGEKLYEELLIGENPQNTHHKKIKKAQDPFIPFDRLKIYLDDLSALLKNNNVVEVKNMLNRLGLSKETESKIVDHIYEEQLISIKDINSVSIPQDEKKVINLKIDSY